jgi:hypothetical protein
MPDPKQPDWDAHNLKRVFTIQITHVGSAHDLAVSHALITHIEGLPDVVEAHTTLINHRKPL